MANSPVGRGRRNKDLHVQEHTDNESVPALMNSAMSGGVDITARVCPYLGVSGDPGTAISFPSLGNHCYHAKPALPVKMEAQRIYCLGTNYLLCEEFNKPPGTPLSAGLRSGRSVRRRQALGRNLLWILLPVIVVVGGIVWFGLSGRLGNTLKPAPPVTEVPVAPSATSVQSVPILLPKIPDTPTPTLTLIPSDTPQPTSTFTPTIEVPRVLETPIGVQPNFIIHRVLEGESLPFLASHYWTTIEAIMAVNFYLPTPVRVGWLIIIPADQTDVSGLPAFEAYQAGADSTVEDLAKQLSVDEVMLKLYNVLSDGETIHSGAWLLIPHNGTAIP
jgi:hypothetical protein